MSDLVLLHGILMSGRSWQDVVPLLSERHQVHSFTTAGHRGGSPAPPRPTTVGDLVDDLERYLDHQQIERPHVAGLSLGGWMAVELARRGRTQTVCALAPGGFWSPGDSAQTHTLKQVRKFVTLSRLAQPLRPVVGFALRSPTVRRIAWRDAACHAERITAAQSVQLLDDAKDCTLNVDDILGSDQHIAPLDPLPCPITIAWSGHDKLVPVASCDPIAHQRIPAATFTTLPGVGHVPMIDDPALVARTILAVTGG